jgi:hypothetical protein
MVSQANSKIVPAIIARFQGGKRIGTLTCRVAPSAGGQPTFSGEHCFEFQISSCRASSFTLLFDRLPFFAGGQLAPGKIDQKIL